MASVDVEAARRTEYPASSWTYSERDVMLYALGVGCSWDESRYVYENSDGFCVLPTFGVLTPYHGVLASLPLHRILPNFNPMLVLHGEQFLQLKRAFPTAGTLLTTPRIIDIQDKGKAAVVVIGTTSIDAATKEVVAENEITTFVRGAGGFGSRSPPAERKAAAIAKNAPPARAADAVTEETTSANLAALYRLSGDYNPLHIDQEFSAAGGFDMPILHGLCSYGISAKHVLKEFGFGAPEAVRTIKGRFAKHVFPGETLRTEMWLVSPTKVIFQTKVVERDAVAISNAAVEFWAGKMQRRAARM